MTSYAIDRTSRRRRSLALATAALFVVSTIFPIAAGLTHDTSIYPAWWGITDVTLAFVLAIMAMAVQRSVEGIALALSGDRDLDVEGDATELFTLFDLATRRDLG